MICAPPRAGVRVRDHPCLRVLPGWPCRPYSGEARTTDARVTISSRRTGERVSEPQTAVPPTTPPQPHARTAAAARGRCLLGCAGRQVGDVRSSQISTCVTAIATAVLSSLLILAFVKDLPCPRLRIRWLNRPDPCLPATPPLAEPCLAWLFLSWVSPSGAKGN